MPMHRGTPLLIPMKSKRETRSPVIAPKPPSLDDPFESTPLLNIPSRKRPANPPPAIFAYEPAPGVCSNLMKTFEFMKVKGMHIAATTGKPQQPSRWHQTPTQRPPFTNEAPKANVEEATTTRVEASSVQTQHRQAKQASVGFFNPSAASPKSISRLTPVFRPPPLAFMPQAVFKSQKSVAQARFQEQTGFDGSPVFRPPPVQRAPVFVPPHATGDFRPALAREVSHEAHRVAEGEACFKPLAFPRSPVPTASMIIAWNSQTDDDDEEKDQVSDFEELDDEDNELIDDTETGEGDHNDEDEGIDDFFFLTDSVEDDGDDDTTTRPLVGILRQEDTHYMEWRRREEERARDEYDLDTYDPPSPCERKGTRSRLATPPPPSKNKNKLKRKRSVLESEDAEGADKGATKEGEKRAEYREIAQSEVPEPEAKRLKGGEKEDEPLSGSALQSAGAREEPTTTIDDKGFNPWTLITPCSPRTPPHCSRVPFEDQEWIEQVLAAHSSPCEESPEVIFFIPEEDVFGSNSDGGVVRQEESPDRARIFKFAEKVFGRDNDDDDLSDEEYESNDKSSMSKRALTFEEQIFGTDSDDEDDEE